MRAPGRGWKAEKTSQCTSFPRTPPFLCAAMLFAFIFSMHTHRAVLSPSVCVHNMNTSLCVCLCTVYTSAMLPLHPWPHSLHPHLCPPMACTVLGVYLSPRAPCPRLMFSHSLPTSLSAHHSMFLTPWAPPSRFHTLSVPPLSRTVAHTPSRCISTTYTLYPQCTVIHIDLHAPPAGVGPPKPQASVEMLGWRDLCAGGSCPRGDSRTEGGASLTWTPFLLSLLYREEPKLCHLLLHRAQGL